MSKRGEQEYLADMREAIHRIHVYTSGLSYDQFLADSKTQDAVIRNIEILGTPAFFVSEQGTRLTDDNARHTFARVSRQIGLRAPTPGRRHGRGPRLHDMRHRFAAATLVAWYRAGRDVERDLPVLATYLGHVHVNDTYWYLEAVPELLALAAARLAVIPAERVP